MLSKVLSIIDKLKYSFTVKSIKLIYNTFFLPHLNYCNTVWSTTYIYIYIYIYIYMLSPENGE